MKKNKKVGIIIIIGVIFIFIGTLIFLKFPMTKTKFQTKTEEKEQTLFNGVDYTDYSFIEKDGSTYFNVTIHNQTQKALIEYSIRINFYSNDEIVSNIDTVIPFLELGQKKDFEIPYLKEKVPDNYTIKVERTSKPIEVG